MEDKARRAGLPVFLLNQTSKMSSPQSKAAGLYQHRRALLLAAVAAFGAMTLGYDTGVLLRRSIRAQRARRTDLLLAYSGIGGGVIALPSFVAEMYPADITASGKSNVSSNIVSILYVPLASNPSERPQPLPQPCRLRSPIPHTASVAPSSAPSSPCPSLVASVTATLSNSPPSSSSPARCAKSRRRMVFPLCTLVERFQASALAVRSRVSL